MVTNDERMLTYCERVMKIEQKGIVFVSSQNGENII